MSSNSSCPPEVPIVYDIADATSHNGPFVPQNIMVNDPSDSSSRWGGNYQGHGKQHEYTVLSSVTESITFGKLKSQHPCNMDEFKVLGGMTMDNWTELLQARLENTPNPETFKLRHKNDNGVLLPIRYVKILPLSAHGSAKSTPFHPSIWYVALGGIVDKEFIQHVQDDYETYRETTTLKFILKHLRERRLLTSFHSTLARTNITLEHPLITSLHTRLVLEGNFGSCEFLLNEIASAGLFSSFIRKAHPTASWRRITTQDNQSPTARGGHAMCIDDKNGKIYLHGGFNGHKSLDDFWVFDTKLMKWELLCASTAEVMNGPVARSCHKMVFDDKTGCIYLLGKLGDSDKVSADEATPRIPSATSEEHPPMPRGQRPLLEPRNSRDGPPSEFYRYHTRGIDKGKWDLLTFDTAMQGGPPLIYDHAMVIDSEAQMIYVFGGRVLDGDASAERYSGLYSYTIATSKWRNLPRDAAAAKIPPRFGHSMVLDPQSHRIFIFAGQQSERYLADMYVFDIQTGTSQEITNNFTTLGGPQRLFSQRAVISPEQNEIYVFHGLTKPASKIAPYPVLHDAALWLYRYDTNQNKSWLRVEPTPSRNENEALEPTPRYAHEVVYDRHNQLVWLFGGNCGEQENGTRQSGTRLDDLWKVHFAKPTEQDIVRRAKFAIRQQLFRELSEDDTPMAALRYLQNEVSTVVDHNDVTEASLFRSLLTHLLTNPSHEEDLPTQTYSAGVETVEDEKWTNVIPILDKVPVNQPKELDKGTWTSSVDTEDAVERKSDAKTAISGNRFKQRHGVFESLLSFINDDAKQPSDNLLDVVDLFRNRSGGL